MSETRLDNGKGKQFAFMRISRGNEVIGNWPVGQIKARMADASLLPTDFYYHEETSEWLPLAGLLARPPAVKPVKAVARPCYCGSGLPFFICHGDGREY
jgi:hypothetical protein